ncbi:pyridoxal phosphatase [Rodentibacter haemolyticus]|uniref:Pyridoxal phosphatase n=1 Tax=Rodentibacter haemolyticus TaxID=2778911 RepID=A0ABX6UUJ2_9PAST|nr:pyridoxal phosphatase [Rodentibacter haemolyticus]QPB41660.1 pyridoxal phosphatase [Rodentibacter haemolyticus]
MNYKAVAFDLDGTLLNGQGQILTENKKAIQTLLEKGIQVILVTGRHHTAVKPYYRELGLTTPIICCNGTYVYDVETDSTPFANPLSKQQAQLIFDVAEKHHCHLLMYSKDSMNYAKLNPHMEKFLQWVESCPPEVRPDVRKVASIQDVIDNHQPIWKCVISAPDKNIMNAVVADLPQGEFSCEWSWVDRIDIANAGNTKGGRLVALLAQWGIDPQQVIAFGDNHNDISMLKAVGLGVAMDNAEDEVKQQAKLITRSNNEAGIADVLKTYFSI